MSWMVIFLVLVALLVPVLLVLAFLIGAGMAVQKLEKKSEKEINRRVDRMLREQIGKTLAGINDKKRYDWRISFDNDGENKCNTTRYGVSVRLSDVVNLVKRRAIEWGCDITKIVIEREDVVMERIEQEKKDAQQKQETAHEN